MSAQTMADVFAPIEERYRQQVMAETWGHLAPKRNRAYKGRVVFAIGCFGSDRLNPTVIVSEFEGLDSSPWFYDALHDFLGERKNEKGCVYEWKGTFRNYVWKGQFTLLVNANLNAKGSL